MEERGGHTLSEEMEFDLSAEEHQDSPDWECEQQSLREKGVWRPWEGEGGVRRRWEDGMERREMGKGSRQHGKEEECRKAATIHAEIAWNILGGNT